MPEPPRARSHSAAITALLGLALTLAACPSSQRAGSAAGAAAKAGKGSKTSAPNAPLQVTLKAVSVDKAKPENRRFGALTLLAAFELESSHRRFGGLSGLAVSADGKRLVMVSDRGRWFSAALQHDAQTGALRGLTGWKTGRLLGVDGRPVKKQRRIDAESVVVRGKTIYVGFEHDHRVLRYGAGLDKKPTALWLPPALRRAPKNGSLEAMTALPDGRLLAICEKYKDDSGALRGFIFDPKTKTETITVEALALVPSDDFKPTDLALLPGGDVLLLERAYSFLGGTRARLSRIAKASLKAGARLAPEELARFDRRHLVDNFEGLAVQRHQKSGKLLLYIISDDNFSRLQRTLLYQLAL